MQFPSSGHPGAPVFLRGPFILRLALPGLLPISLPFGRVGHPEPEHLSSRSLRVGAPAEASQVLPWEPVADEKGWTWSEAGW